MLTTHLVKDMIDENLAHHVLSCMHTAWECLNLVRKELKIERNHERKMQLCILENMLYPLCAEHAHDRPMLNINREDFQCVDDLLSNLIKAKLNKLRYQCSVTLTGVWHCHSLCTHNLECLVEDDSTDRPFDSGNAMRLKHSLDILDNVEECISPFVKSSHLDTF